MLLGIVRQSTKANTQDRWSFTCGFSWTLGSLSKCGQLKSFYRYYFGRCFSELVQLVPLPFSRGRSTRYSDRLHYFSVTIPRCYKDVYVSSFFPGVARLWNYLHLGCFPLTSRLNAIKSRINRHLLTVALLHEVNKSNVTSCFQGNLTILLFFSLPGNGQLVRGQF